MPVDVEPALDGRRSRRRPSRGGRPPTAGLALVVGQVGGDQQGGDHGREGERGVAPLVLPAVLLGRRAAPDDVARRPAGPSASTARGLGAVSTPVAAEQVEEQDGQGRLARAGCRSSTGRC